MPYFTQKETATGEETPRRKRGFFGLLLLSVPAVISIFALVYQPSTGSAIALMFFGSILLISFLGRFVGTANQEIEDAPKEVKPAARGAFFKTVLLCVVALMAVLCWVGYLASGILGGG